MWLRRLGAAVWVTWCGVATAATLHVAPAGDDAARGTAVAPLATLQAALRQIGPAGGGEVVLLDGTWNSRERIGGAFAAAVTIRAARPGRAVLRECLIHEAVNVVVEGVRFDGRDNPRVTNVCQVSRSGVVTLRDCEFTHGVGGHDNADSLKVNDGSHHVLVERCRFSDGTDEELDVLQADVHDLVFRDNVFLQTRARKPEAAASVKKNAHRVVFAGNVFTAMNEDSSNGALRFGGSETTAERPHDLLALDNVFVRNAGRCDLNLGGASRVLVAGNVFFGSRCRGVVEVSTNYPQGGNPNDECFLVNNVFADADGRLPTPYALRNGAAERFTIRGNVYFNGGGPVVAARQGRSFFDPAREPGAPVADPSFVGPLDFAGPPALAWRDALAVRAGSPAHAARVPLAELDLPDSLRNLLDAYLRGAGDDDWYRRIRRE